MSNRADLEKAMVKFLEFRNRPDLEAMLGMFHPQASFCISGTPKLGAFTQRVTMSDTLPEAISHLIDVWDLNGVEVVSMHIDDDTLFIHRAGTVKHIPTNVSFQTEFMDKVTFRNGLIIDYTQFVDTYGIAKVAGMG